MKKYEAEGEISRINENEVWRYCGYMGTKESVNDELKSLFVQVVDELKNSFSYNVCYRYMDISWEDGMPLLPFYSKSEKLAKCLRGSSRIVIFAATVGLGIDRLIAKYQRFSPSKALLMQAYGAERVEKLCNVFCHDIKEEVAACGLKCSARFSPGYGDLPLTVQKEFFNLLDCNRKIGISLNDSLLMTPSKSVTAVFGIGECYENN